MKNGIIICLSAFVLLLAGGPAAAQNNPPVCDCNGPYTGFVGIPVVLDGSGSFDPDEGSGDSIISYMWDLDGDALYDDAVGSTPSYMFPGPVGASHLVSLQVTDTFGASGTCMSLVNVVTSPPSVEAGPDDSGSEGSTISLSPATFTDPEPGDAHTSTINWGDGTPDEVGFLQDFGGSGTVAGDHVYADNGVYTVTVTVTDNHGASGSDTFTATISNIAPIVDSGSSFTVDEGTSHEMSASFNDPGTLDTHTATIDWGDTESDPGVVTETPFGPPGSASGMDGTVGGSHAWADNGSYTVTVQVLDDDGGSASDAVVATINNMAPVVEAGPDQTVGRGAVLSLDPATFSDQGSADTHTATIAWGDGDVTPGTVDPLTRTVSGSHVYTNTGDHVVTVSVTDDDAAMGMDSFMVTVTGEWVVDPGGAEDFTTVQDCIDFVVDGETCRVNPGTYVENIDFTGKDIVVESVSGADTTILDGGGAGTVVTFDSGESEAAVLEGFTIRHGGSSLFGGGILCENASAPTIRDCVITGNTGSNYGGGIACRLNASPTITNCILAENTAAAHGGALYISTASPVMIHCTLVGNSSTHVGGGVFCEGASSSVTVTNSILWENSPDEVYQLSGSLSIEYSNVQGGWTGTGNIDENPLFVGVDDFHLSAGSPCIDSGTGAGVSSDLDGDPRPFLLGVDMGADEYAGPCWDLDADGFSDEICGGDDCDDGDFDVNPGASEGPFGDATCADGVDNDCDATMDGDDTGCWQCSVLADCDDENACTLDDCVDTLCENTLIDCDDGNGCTDDSCDAVDGCENLCNAVDTVDPCCEDPACAGDPVCEEPECIDNDGDGYGNPEHAACPNPGLDCDDSDPDIHPGATETPGDGMDSNCNGQDDCFIATAAFGNSMEGKIDVLRTFRDNRLMKTKAGKALVTAYYKYSPPIASYISERSWLRALVRTLLLPAIGLISLAV